MDFFEVISKRRSIRKFDGTPVPESVIEKALDAAILAPNSSNLQTWDFYWVRSQENREKLVRFCLNQSAARSADQLMVVTADPALWRRSQPALVKFVEDVKAPSLVQMYYKRLIPVTYRWGMFNVLFPFKWILGTCIGFFKPITRGPYTRGALQNVCIKSSALAAENFVLAVTAQGYDTCMMEGFDAWRVGKLLKLPRSARVVMVIAIGKASDRGTWGPQFRIEREKVIHQV